MITYMHKMWKKYKICIERDFFLKRSLNDLLTKNSCYYVDLNMHSWNWSNAKNGFVKKGRSVLHSCANYFEEN